MTAGPPAGLPDGLTLSRWWQQLAPLTPRGLWVGDLDLTHLDALVRAARPRPLDPLHWLLLRAVEATAPATPDRLDARLGLGRAPLVQWLLDLEAAGLVRAGEGGALALTAAGAQALASGDYPQAVRERRRFTFVDVPGGAPHFLPWRPPAGRACPPGAAGVQSLLECVARPADWKRAFGFPEDVVGVEAPDPELPPEEAWRRVVVARGERVPVALAVAAPDGGPERLLGFVAAGDDLKVDAPALRLDGGWAEPFPDVDYVPPIDAPLNAVETDGWALVRAIRLWRAVKRDGGE
jgi:hypothetical protein